ncbi:hypothetical protein D9M72_618940 [compost metagenome]
MEGDAALAVGHAGNLAGTPEVDLECIGQAAVAAVGGFPGARLGIDQEALALPGGDGLGARVAQLAGHFLAGVAQPHAVDATVHGGGGDHPDDRDQGNHEQHLQQ